MGRIEGALKELELSLPEPLVPPGNFRLVRIHNDLAFVAGHGPFAGATLLMEGVIGRDLSREQGYEAAKLTALSIFASLKVELGDLGSDYPMVACRWLRTLQPRLW